MTKLLERYSSIIGKHVTDMTLDDTYNLTQVYNDIGQARATEKYEKAKLEQEAKDKESMRTLELKSEMTDGDKPKNLYTEVEIKSMISQELLPLKEKINEKEYIIDQLSVAMQTIQMIQPIARDYQQSLGYNQGK